MQSEFPDASNRTVSQNCFLLVVSHGIGLAILFLYIHISASALAWAVFTQLLPLLACRVWDEEEQEASHTSPSSSCPPCLRHTPAHMRKDHGIYIAGGRGWDAAEVLKKEWRCCWEPALSSTAISISRFPRRKIQLPATGDELSERRNLNNHLEKPMVSQ